MGTECMYVHIYIYRYTYREREGDLFIYVYIFSFVRATSELSASKVHQDASPVALVTRTIVIECLNHVYACAQTMRLKGLMHP